MWIKRLIFWGTFSKWMPYSIIRLYHILAIGNITNITLSNFIFHKRTQVHLGKSRKGKTENSFYKVGQFLKIQNESSLRFMLWIFIKIHGYKKIYELDDR